LELLEDERAITHTLVAYGHAIDYGDEEAWVRCFADDGIFDIRGRESGHPHGRIVGRQELRRFIVRHTRAPERWHKHLLIDPMITIDGTTAHCISYYAVLMEHDGAPIVRVFGRYRDRLTKEEDGAWRFAERVAQVESMRPGLPPFIDGRPNGEPS
jgi:ketosteroid isomerase-like protein